MKAKRKRHSAAFKAKVGFEALVGLKTVRARAARHGGPGAVDRPTASEDWPDDGGPGLA